MLETYQKDYFTQRKIEKERKKRENFFDESSRESNPRPIDKKEKTRIAEGFGSNPRLSFGRIQVTTLTRQAGPVREKLAGS